MYTYIFKGDTMLEKIKNFVKSVSSTTWILVTVAVVCVVFFTYAAGHTPAPVVAPETVPAK